MNNCSEILHQFALTYDVSSKASRNKCIYKALQALNVYLLEKLEGELDFRDVFTCADNCSALHPKEGTQYSNTHHTCATVKARVVHYDVHPKLIMHKDCPFRKKMEIIIERCRAYYESKLKSCELLSKLRKLRLDEFQRVQDEFREPERTILCNILANGRHTS